MSGRRPDEIWRDAINEGERRVSRASGGLLATGFVGGMDIMLGVLALSATTGSLTAAVGAQPAHLAGAAVFGIGFAFLIIGRGELFTENFLVPIATLTARRTRLRYVLRLWGLTFVGNYVGIAVLAAVFAASGVLTHETLKAASVPADLLAGRAAWGAFVSGILGGGVMTLMTWLTHAVELDVSRILIGLAMGFLLAVATMNHAVVSFGEMMLPIFAGTTHLAAWDVVRTLLLAVAGNLVGGLGLVTITRLVQVLGEEG
jgi:formate/nitrite transporter FocA (FNT family)